VTDKEFNIFAQFIYEFAGSDNSPEDYLVKLLEDQSTKFEKYFYL